ncbi:hypothetical protein AMTRI_Chr04g253390 [Amborella trichopoda]|uniref:Uncharacterized protein n=1 Tax=Amborella trichopoda TaxID=13333 RepID=W1NFE3_AMBTC|nr:photosynthetic NDH subunit of lumenal location 2, chloroplastic [Amborella trichopoda]ERM94542.1 hypothetical protein AMTR_s00010p00265990 [Amborella trichopoda]|eukprot:XP_006827305.1 photosynthetic NDH subunit of lumenal location 2, chloroplastic [Amborella trichopoda]
MESLSNAHASPSNLCRNPNSNRKSHQKIKFRASRASSDTLSLNRRALIGTITVAFTAAEISMKIPTALAEEWGSRSFLLERYFMPSLSPENAAARIKQTSEGLHRMRSMLDRMAWRYVIFYIRQKMTYLSSDLKSAMATLPENRRKSYVRSANELVENMAELDSYVRTPRVYESYLYYEKTLKSLDELVALLA